MTLFNNECYFCILYKMNINYKIISTIILITLIMSGCAIDKGFESLSIYNYFDAKQRFESSEKRKIVPASYGLSIIYQRNDNPFFNLDSALIKINTAYSNYSILSLKQKEKYHEYGLDSLGILKQRHLISDLYFNRAIETNSVYGFQEFIDKNEWSSDVSTAIVLRDSLFFFERHEKGRAVDYELFMTTYPNSIYTTKADKLYNKAFFKESTITNSITDYVQYIINKPNGDFVAQAENSIFKLATVHKTLAEYNVFIINYPENRNVNKAWMLLFDRYTENSYSIKDIEQFLVDYPDYPFKHKISNELFKANIKFFKYKIDYKWGFISEEGKYYIDPIYDFVEDFFEGLAVVTLNGKTGYITKTSDIKIKPQFDDGYSFQNGFAVVEVDEYFGLINRSGEFIVEPTFDDLGNVYEGFLNYEIDGVNGFLNSKGEMVIFHQYSDVSNFKNHLAIVEKDNMVGVIDTNGNTKIQIKYDAVKMMQTNLFAVKNNDLWGIVNLSNEVILPFEYDFIEFDADSLVLVEKNNEFNYWNSSTQEFITDIWFENFSEHRVLAKFDNGFAKIKTDKGYNFINYKAELVFEKYYSNLGVFGKYVGFESPKGWGYLNLQGKVIVKPNYTKTHSFSIGGGVVELSGNKGLVDTKGEIVLPIFYEELKLINDTTIIVKKNNQYGILSHTNYTIVPLKYNLIEPISKSIVKVVSEAELTYYNYVNRTWLKKEE
jgi:hypothetical protein